ncbi:DNA-binding protein [Paraburkholderia unamae]|uniref:DNA-binding protein n=1 Tax=Paraburkholderia unamae TaxID=219649 RepID=UPI003CCC60D5
MGSPNPPPCRSRTTAAVTPDAIRATVLALLAEAGDPAPASDARFRKIVSVRKLRARLGAGDPATLSRHLNAIEAEVVQAGLAPRGQTAHGTAAHGTRRPARAALDA